MEKFIILSSQRSGSTYLRTYLNSHPHITCHGEVFIDKRYDKEFHADRFYAYCERKKLRSFLSSIRLDRYMASTFIDHFYRNAKYMHGAYGFKLMYNQLERYKIDVRFLAKKGVKFIHHGFSLR